MSCAYVVSGVTRGEVREKALRWEKTSALSAFVRAIEETSP